MKHRVTRFKSLELAITELAPFVRNGRALHTGRPLKRLGMLPREALGNWLICAVANSAYQADHMTFTSDPLDGDGVICDTKTGNTWLTEHVMARGPSAAGIDAMILGAVRMKQSKGGRAYAAGRTLIVFLEGSGDVAWSPNRVARQLPRLDFDAIWVVGLHGSFDGTYLYGVTLLDMSDGNAPVWIVTIASDFKSWTVAAIQ